MMALCMVAFAMALGSGKKPNILMIASDDMRPEMSPYGPPATPTARATPLPFPHRTCGCAWWSDDAV